MSAAMACSTSPSCRALVGGPALSPTPRWILACVIRPSASRALRKIADLLAGQRGEAVAYTWWAQRRGFVRNTLKAEACDVIIGVPAHYDLVLTTRPYYRSTYVFVSRADRKLDITSLRDERLRQLR